MATILLAGKGKKSARLTSGKSLLKCLGKFVWEEKGDKTIYIFFTGW
jgi:hypothetical protein